MVVATGLSTLWFSKRQKDEAVQTTKGFADMCVKPTQHIFCGFNDIWFFLNTDHSLFPLVCSTTGEAADFQLCV